MPDKSITRRRRTTSYDVAKLAGVSQSTVSFVLSGREGITISNETRQRVLAAARQLGYSPNAAARSLARQQTRTLGLAILYEPRSHFSANAFLPAVIEGITSVAGPAGFKL